VSGSGRPKTKRAIARTDATLAKGVVATLDQQVTDRLIAKFGPTINLRAGPKILVEVLREISVATENMRAASEHYKGDTFTKEGPYGKTYEKNYIRGYAMTDLVPERGELIQSELDRVLLARIRAVSPSTPLPGTKPRLP
jgi:hypothetical protein